MSQIQSNGSILLLSVTGIVVVATLISWIGNMCVHWLVVPVAVVVLVGVAKALNH